MWNVNVAGSIPDVRVKLDKAFRGPASADGPAGPLAARPAGLTNDGERETVRLVAGVIDQCLATFDPALPVVVEANGSLGRNVKGGAFQQVNLSIQPAK